MDYQAELKYLYEKIPSEISDLFIEEISDYLVIVDNTILINKTSANFNEIAIENKKELIITVPRNFAVKATFHIFIIQTDSSLKSNLKIVLKENSEFDYFEYLVNTTKSEIDFVSKSFISENSKLKYLGISNFTKEAKVFVTRECSVERYGSCLYNLAEISDANEDIKTNVYLNGKYANATVKTVAITSDNQKVLLKQIIEHNAPETEGYIENYGVANNQSILVFEGVGKINKNMKQSIARQLNKGIVLGVASRLEANPLLLIDEYDVEASHGAAIGKIDEEQLYYLMSRGLTHKFAERLIISGFLSSITKELSTDRLKESFLKIVERKTL